MTSKKPAPELTPIVSKPVKHSLKRAKQRRQLIDQLAEQVTAIKPTARDNPAQDVPPEVSERIKRCLQIDPESPSGLSWKAASGRRGGHAQPGKMAGSLSRRVISKKGTRRADWVIGIGHRVLTASRVVYFLHHGRWPVGQVDHIDRNPLNNHPENLRDVSAAQNMHNRKPAKGCYLHKKTGRHGARIGVNGRYVSLGYYETEAEAHAAYVEARKRLHLTAANDEQALPLPRSNADGFTPLRDLIAGRARP